MKKIILLFSVVILFSCDIIDRANNQLDTNSNMVDINSAKAIASDISFKTSENSILQKGNMLTKKKVKSVDSINDDSGEAALYVINYEEGGFLILSSDNRIQPVLAFSNESSFELGLEEIPEGVTDWIADKKEFVKEIRSKNREQTEKEKKAWDLTIIQAIVSQGIEEKKGGTNSGSGDTNVLVVPPDPDECTTQFIVKGPLISTKWDQYENFNGLIEFGNCSNTYNKNKLVGCLGISIAQILYYHKKSGTYNWDQIPIYGGTNETYQLVLDAAESVGTVYGCYQSGASFSKTLGAFKTDFGYRYGNYSTNYSYSQARSSLNNNNPVLLTGGTHGWICDGYQEYISCPEGNTYIHLSMKWGWGGSHDGWYSFDNWSTPNGNYNSNKAIVYNIKP